jgi:hypothetical protein
LRLTALAGLLALGVSACSAATQQPIRGGQRDLITLEEIKASKNSTANAWDFIATARPQYLRDRGVGSFNDTSPVRALVYLDGSMLGDLRTLRSINMTSVMEIRYMSGADATTRYGMNHSGGVILIKTH